MNIDISKSPQQNLLDLVNSTNSATSLALQLNQFTIGTPSVIEPDAQERNTQIVLTAVPNAGYSGTKTIKYRRINTGQAVPNPNAPITILPSDTQDVIKQKIATALNLRLDQLTFVVDGSDWASGTNEIPIPTDEDTPVTIVSVIGIANGLLYDSDNWFTVTLVVPDADIPLEDAIVISDLDGFDPYQAP